MAKRVAKRQMRSSALPLSFADILTEGQRNAFRWRSGVDCQVALGAFREAIYGGCFSRRRE